MSDRTPAPREHQSSQPQRMMAPRCRSVAFNSSEAIRPAVDTRPACSNREDENFIEELERWDGQS